MAVRCNCLLAGWHNASVGTLREKVRHDSPQPDTYLLRHQACRNSSWALREMACFALDDGSGLKRPPLELRDRAFQQEPTRLDLDRFDGAPHVDSLV